MTLKPIGEKLIELVGRFEWYPMADTLEALIPPLAGHLLCGPLHLTLEQGNVEIRPDAHDRTLNRG